MRANFHEFKKKNMNLFRAESREREKVVILLTFF